MNNETIIEFGFRTTDSADIGACYPASLRFCRIKSSKALLLNVRKKKPNPSFMQKSHKDLSQLDSNKLSVYLKRRTHH